MQKVQVVAVCNVGKSSFSVSFRNSFEPLGFPIPIRTCGKNTCMKDYTNAGHSTHRTSMPSAEFEPSILIFERYKSIQQSQVQRTGIIKTGVLGFDSRRGLGLFLFTTASRTALGSRGPLSLHLVQRSKNEWSYTSTPPIHFHGIVLS
jgi:hypothetical protein